MTNPNTTRVIDRQRAIALVRALIAADGAGYVATMKELRGDQHEFASSGLLFASVDLTARIALSYATPEQALAALDLAALELGLEPDTEPPTAA